MPSQLTALPSQLKLFLNTWIMVTMSYTVMSNEVLKEFDRKIYYAVTKIQNDRKFAEINTIYKKVIKTPIFKDISRDRLPDRVDKLLENGTLLIKPNRDKYSLRINSNKIKYPSVNIAAA